MGKHQHQQTDKDWLQSSSSSCQRARPRAEQCIITDNDLCIVNVGMDHLLFWLGCGMSTRELGLSNDCLPSLAGI